METKYNITAINLSESINLKKLKQDLLVGESLEANLISYNSAELFYKIENNYLAVFNYGVIAFTNTHSIDVSRLIDFLKPYCEKPNAERKSEYIELVINDAINFMGSKLMIPEISENVIRISMFDLSQTVAIDHYSQIMENILSDIKKFASELERYGKLKISKKNMIKFIGRSLTLKNMIIENLYIFDAPDITWDDEHLEKIHKRLVREFDLAARLKEIEYTFQIIDSNLQMFKELYHHSHSAKLEIIVIALILIEVINLLIEKIHIF